MIYEMPMTDRILRIRQVVKAPTPRWTFEGGMREAAREALAVLWHEANEWMAHSQYLHFLSWIAEGAEAVVLPAGDHDRSGCSTDQVKLTHALVQDLDEAVKVVNYHTWFLSQNWMLIVCVPRNQAYTHTIQKMDIE
jgi:hypothetical protein